MSSREQILRVLDAYFGGIHAGDLERLRSAFHPTAVLWGEIKGQPYHKSLQEYLEVVRTRQAPQALGEPYAMEVLSIEVHGRIALAKVRCPIFGFNYTDLLSLIEQDGRWGIVAKVFTHLDPR
jgi:hypothetical protein